MGTDELRPEYKRSDFEELVRGKYAAEIAEETNVVVLEPELVCDICREEGTRIRRITRSYGKRSGLLVIENVPIVSCPHCGESYLTAETMHEIERIKMHRNNFAVGRPVPVVEFA